MKRACWHISICAKTIKKRSHTQSLHAIMISLIQCANSLLPIFILQRPILSLPRLFCLLEAVKLQYNEQPPCRYQRHRGCVSIIFLLTLRRHCALPGFVDSKNEEKTERNAGYLVVSQSGGGMLRQGTREGIRRTPANRGMRAHRIVKGLDISEDVCHGMCP